MYLRSADKKLTSEWIWDRIKRASRDLPAVVDEVCVTFVSTESSKIENVLPLPANCMDLSESRQRIDLPIGGEACNHSTAVDRLTTATGTGGKSTQVVERTSTCPKCMLNIRVVAEERICIWPVRIQKGGVGATGHERLLLVEVAGSPEDHADRASKSAHINQPIPRLFCVGS